MNPAARFDGPVQHAHSFADQTVFFTDPAGNHYAVYTPTKSAIAPRRQLTDA